MLIFTPTLMTNDSMTRMWILRAVEQQILHQVQIANQWYTENGMIVNGDNTMLWCLGTTDHKFSFPVEDSLYLLGLTFDNQFNFNEHVSLVCKKVNNQLNVMIRFRKLICTATKLKLYIML